MKNKNILNIVLILLAGVIQANAQTIIRGVVTDSITGETMIGATIVQIDASNRFINGSITDYNGNYSIKVEGTDVTLGFSFIGYRFKTIKAKGRTTINIGLAYQAEEME